MGKMKTKSILVCAVLASVLAGGFGMWVSRAEAADETPKFKYKVDDGEEQTWDGQSNLVLFGGGGVSYNGITLEVWGEGANTSYSIYGGYDGGSGTITGKTVIFDSGSVGAVYGGYSDTGIVSNNHVNMTDGIFSKGIYGGYSNTGSVSDNQVNITDGIFSNGIYGGYSNTGIVSNNHVNMTDGIFSKGIYGGYSITGSVSDNQVNITDGTILCDIHGGLSNTGIVSKNQVNIAGGVFSGHTNLSGMPTLRVIYGGKSEKSDTKDNIVTISGGKFEWVSLYGGKAGTDKISSGNILNVNTVINGSFVEVADFQIMNFNVPDGCVNSADQSEVYQMLNVTSSADFSNVDITATNIPDLAEGDYITLIRGGNGTIFSLKDDSHYQVVQFPNYVELVYANGIPMPGTDYTVIQKNEDGNVLKQYCSESGDNTYNKIIAGNMDIGGNYCNNEIIICKGVYTNIIYGGRSENDDDAIGNVVTINSGVYRNAHIYGGSSENGNANNNQVNIADGIFSGGSETYPKEIYGGSSLYGDAKDNVVTISGGKFERVSLYGGKAGTDKISSGNILNLKSVIGGTASEVKYFQTMNFTIPTGMDKEMPMMNVSTPVVLHDSVNGDIDFSTDLNGISLSNGEYITLIKNVDDADFVLPDTNYKVLDFGVNKKELVYGNNPVATADFEITAAGKTSVVGSKYYNNGDGTTDVIDNKSKTYNYKIQGNVDLTDGTSTTNYSGNKITIRRGTYNEDICGAKSDDNNNVTENGIRIYDGIFGSNIHGGWSSSGNVIGNCVTIKNGTFEKNICIYGGYSSNNGDAADNNVVIDGGTFESNSYIYGGISTYGDAKDNVVTISGGKFKWVRLYGGKAGTDKISSGNTLNVNTVINGSFLEVADFQIMNFTLPTWMADEPVIDATNAVSLNGVTVNVYLNGQEPDAITLINKVENNGTYKVYTGSGDSAEITNDYIISVDNGKLLLKTDVVLWYMVGDEEFKFGRTATQFISDNSGKDVTLYRGSGTDNEYTGIKIKGALIVGAERETGKSFLVSGDLTADGGVTVQFNNTLNIGSGNLNSDVTNNGILNINGTENNYTGTVNLAKVDGIGTMNINGGTVNGKGNITQAILNISGGTLDVKGTLSVNHIIFTLPTGVVDNSVIINASNAVPLNGVTVNVYLNGQEPDTITLIDNVENNGIYEVYTGSGDSVELTDDYTISVDNNSLVLKSLQSLWYTVGDDKHKFLPSAAAQSINDNSGEDVVLYRGAGTDNEYTGINITGALTVGAETEIGKSFLVSGDLTANGGVTVATKNTLNVAASNLKTDVTNNGTVNLGAGTLATGSTITGGTLNIIGDVTANAGDIAGNVNNIASGTTLILNGGDLTGGEKIIGATTSKLEIQSSIQNSMEINADGIRLTNNAVFTTNADKILSAGQFDISSGAELDLTGGTFNFPVINREGGTVLVVKDATVKLGSGGHADKMQVAGTLNMNGQTDRVTNLDLTATGTLNLQNDASETVVFENLTAAEGAKVNFDAKFTADGDKISAETGSGELALGSIGVKDDFVGNAGDTTTITFLTGKASIALTGSAETVFGAYKYIFEPGTTAGTLKVTKDNGYSLVDIINDRIDNHVAGQVSNYSLNDDKTMDADMGTLTRPDSKVAREFTINGNNNKLLGGNKAGITVKSGDTLTYKDIAEVSGFNGAAVINNGTFNANNVTFKNEIAGSGTMNVDGVVNADAKVSNKMNVAGTGTLNIAADNLKNAVTNNGTVNLGAGTLATGNTITGGTLNITDDVTANADDIAGNTNIVAENKTLTLNGGAVNRAITNNGTVKLNGATLGGAYVAAGILEFAADTSVNADYVVAETNMIAANKTLTLNGGNLTKTISGAGNVTIGNGIDAVVLIADPKLFANTGDLTVANNSILKTNVAVNREIKGGGTVESTDNVSITDNVEINRLATNGKVITVGNTDAAGHVSATTIQLNGGMIFLDPDWKDGENLIEDATHVATANTTNLDGAYVVGRNSVLTFGATNDDADAVFGETGLIWGNETDNITAAAYVAKTVNLVAEKGSLTVDGELTSAPDSVEAGTVKLAANSLLMVNTRGLTDNTVITGVSSLDVTNETGKKATIYLRGARTGQDIYITDAGAATSDLTNLTLAGLGAKFAASASIEDGKLKVHVESGSLAILDETVIPNVGNALETNGNEDAAAFLDKVSMMTDDASAIQAVNSVANLGENLGVSRGAYDVVNMVGDAIDNHWDDNRVQDSGVRIQEKRKVWAVGTRNKETVDGVELGGMEAQYDAQYNGAVVGLNWSGNFGMAINYIDGKVNNKLGGHNNAEYYGGSLYAKTDWGNLRITADATYTYGKNELSQNGITADAKTETISGGLTLKYMAKAGLNKIGPFAGIRYMHIKGRDYTDSLGVNREADKINSMVVPVGLEYTAEFKMKGSNWTWKPMLMAGYLFNLGDRTNDMFLRYNDAMDTFAYDLVDKGAFFARAGMAFAKKNFTLGISYDIMKSKNSDYDRWNVNMDVAF